MTKVMFVCHGNICRSPMAEFVLKDMVKKSGEESDFQITSSATSTEEIGNPVHHGTRSILAKRNISVDGKYAVQMKKTDYDEYDYIIAMDSYNIRNIMRIVGYDPDGKVYKLLDFADGGDIADPWYTGDFDITYRDVVRGCKGFLEKLKEEDCK